MLFNSYFFIILFLPFVIFIFFVLGRFSEFAAVAWLTVASLTFYVSWKWNLIFLLLASIFFNYAFSILITELDARNLKAGSKWATIFAVTTNLACLGYFKYMNFFVDQFEHVIGTSFGWQTVILPIGISFFTFTQIAYLVDSFRGRATEFNFVHYVLFVSYFPHLIAGPILHYSEFMPQLRISETFRPRAAAIAVGMTVFALGLFKKVGLADSVAPFADAAFTAKQSLTFVEAWCGTIAFSLQIYFDFSGYSDMAIGMSRMMNIKLPMNFNSPYKSLSVIEFWRRWHITLSRFLRDYLYFPLGGNRSGSFFRYRNLLITMILGGLWHGAGWTFLIWGALHGAYLCANHAWRHFRQTVGFYPYKNRKIGHLASWLLTFIAVTIAWVFFRAPDIHSAVAMMKGIFGINGLSLPADWYSNFGRAAPILSHLGIVFSNTPVFFGTKEILWLVALLLISVQLPNLQQFTRGQDLALENTNRNDDKGIQTFGGINVCWKPSIFWANISFVALIASLAMMTKISPFLYFQF